MSKVVFPWVWDGSKPVKQAADKGGNAFCGGMRPNDPHSANGTATASSATWTTLISYTPSGKTFLLTDLEVREDLTYADDFLVRVMVAGGLAWGGRGKDGGSYQKTWVRPLVISDGQQLTVDVYQDTGGDRWFIGFIAGFHPDG